jgi:hypothetical protein
VAYLPFVRDPKVRLYAPHAARAAGAVESFQLEARGDYTTDDWYTAGQNAPAWSDPYVDDATRTTVVGYSVPLFAVGVAPLRVVGVVRGNITFDDMRTLLSGLRLGQTEYGFLVSRKGTYIEHPDENYVRARRSALDDARESSDDVRLEALQRALRGDPAEHESRSTATGQDIWVFDETAQIHRVGAQHRRLRRRSRVGRRRQTARRGAGARLRDRVPRRREPHRLATDIGSGRPTRYCLSIWIPAAVRRRGRVPAAGRNLFG